MRLSACGRDTKTVRSGSLASNWALTPASGAGAAAVRRCGGGGGGSVVTTLTWPGPKGKVWSHGSEKPLCTRLPASTYVKSAVFGTVPVSSKVIRTLTSVLPESGQST